MRINEVEALAGITKKNIRFYEEQGLLSPKRNAENGYRDYGEEDVRVLLRIKTLRKLGVPIEEIRHMLSGTHTVGDGMRRHLITLEREQRNLEQSIALCKELQKRDIPISELNTELLLKHMEDMEKGGTSFENKQENDVRKQYVAPIVITILIVVFLIAMSLLVIWSYQISVEEAPPIWFAVISIIIFVGIGGGVVLALLQRMKEISKGEVDDARYY